MQMKKRNWSQVLGNHHNRTFVPPCRSMSDSEDLLKSTDTQEPSGYGVHSPPPPPSSSPPPPPYSNQEVHPPPPPYSAVPPQYLPAKVATDSSSLSSIGYESFADLRHAAQTDTTPLLSSSAFDDKAVRRGFVRKVCATVSLKYCMFTRWGLSSSTCRVYATVIVRVSVMTLLRGFEKFRIFFLPNIKIW